MTDDTLTGIGIVVALGVLIAAFPATCETGKHKARRESERAAVQAGHAEYYLDEKHERQFRWKEAK